jgi:hypothetical protein
MPNRFNWWRTAAEYDLRAVGADVDLDKTMRAVNALLGEGITLAIGNWDDKGSSVFTAERAGPPAPSTHPSPASAAP